MSDEWDDNEFPLAYLLTFRTFGTWHHGDERGSVDRRNFNKYGAPKIASNSRFVDAEIDQILCAPFLLSEEQRELVESVIREVCVYREYDLHALNVRTNHVHAVVSALVKPEKMVEAFKSYATRKLRSGGLISIYQKIWSRHASTRYLWKERNLTGAIDYVLYSQGDEFPNFDELAG
jgi:REP element-mobilizing transposase RayT